MPSVLADSFSASRVTGSSPHAYCTNRTKNGHLQGWLTKVSFADASNIAQPLCRIGPDISDPKRLKCHVDMRYIDNRSTLRALLYVANIGTTDCLLHASFSRP